MGFLLKTEDSHRYMAFSVRIPSAQLLCQFAPTSVEVNDGRGGSQRHSEGYVATQQNLRDSVFGVKWRVDAFGACVRIKSTQDAVD